MSNRAGDVTPGLTKKKKEVNVLRVQRPECSLLPYSVQKKMIERQTLHY